MKSVLTVLVFLFYLPPVAQSDCELTIEITDLRTDKGSVSILLFNSPIGFYQDASKSIGKARAEIIQGKAHYTWKHLPAGQYAITAIHDENNNHKLDTNFLGIPTEGIAVSQNAIGRFWQVGSFAEAAIVVNKPHVDAHFRMVY